MPQVLLRSVSSTTGGRDHLWLAVHAKSSDKLDGQARCWHRVVRSTLDACSRAHRRSDRIAGKQKYLAGMTFGSKEQDRMNKSENSTSLMQGQSPQLLVTWWQLAYWYGFAAQFTLLPFHQEYADSGHFTVGDRINTAIRNNLIFYAVLVVRHSNLICQWITSWEEMALHAKHETILLSHTHVCTACSNLRM